MSSALRPTDVQREGLSGATVPTARVRGGLTGAVDSIAAAPRRADNIAA